MPPIQSELLRRAVGVVCEILIAELREILLHKRKNVIETKLAKRKLRPEFHPRKNSQGNGPQPITVVSVDGMSVVASGSGHEDYRAEVIIPDDPLGNVQIKQEVQDDISFEDHFHDTDEHSMKTEVKEEMFIDDLMDCTVEDSSSNGLTEDSSSKLKIENEDVAVKQEAYYVNRGNPGVSEENRMERKTSTSNQKPPKSSTSTRDNMQKSHVCKVCTKSFPTLNKLSKHSLTHEVSETGHKCSKCKKCFTDISKLKEHFLTHTEGKVEGSLYSCEYCKRKYSDKKSLTRHKVLHFRAHSYASDVIRKKYPGLHRRNLLESRRLWRQMTYKCKLCPKGFRCVSNLVKHVHFHHKPKCSTSFM